MRCRSLVRLLHEFCRIDHRWAPMIKDLRLAVFGCLQDFWYTLAKIREAYWMVEFQVFALLLSIFLIYWRDMFIREKLMVSSFTNSKQHAPPFDLETVYLIPTPLVAFHWCQSPLVIAYLTPHFSPTHFCCSPFLLAVFRGVLFLVLFYYILDCISKFSLSFWAGCQEC